MQRVREPLIDIRMRDINFSLQVLALMTIVMTIAYPSLHNLSPKIYQPDKRKDDGAYKSLLCDSFLVIAGEESLGIGSNIV